MEEKRKIKHKFCVLEEGEQIPCTGCGECERCDLNPNKICDNCGECLKDYELPVNEKGFFEFTAKLDNSQTSLDDLLEGYGLDDNDDNIDEKLKRYFSNQNNSNDETK